MSKERQQRRSVLKAAAGAAAAVSLAVAPRGARAAEAAATKKVYRQGPKPKTPPLFSGAVSFGNLLFLAGVGAHFEGDIKAHTKHVLDEIENKLKECGSSMTKVLKCNVYLNDLKDYDGMNEVFRGRFGDDPPVRTTIAAAGGIPGKSLVEIDVIAHL
jgi:2-iminobutanoate/2-iminopropanoate deaminase